MLSRAMMTAPEINAALAVLSGDDDDSRFRVEFGCNDSCDAAPGLSATLNGISVRNGQLVSFEQEDDDEEAEFDDGVLVIEAPSLELMVSCQDASGNTSAATATPAFPVDDDDDDDDGSVGDDGGDDDDDDGGDAGDDD